MALRYQPLCVNEQIKLTFTIPSGTILFAFMHRSKFPAMAATKDLHGSTTSSRTAWQIVAGGLPPYLGMQHDIRPSPKRHLPRAPFLATAQLESLLEVRVCREVLFRGNQRSSPGSH